MYHAWERQEIHTKEKIHWEDLGTDGRIYIKMDLKETECEDMD
jgi:hypothetical protein